MFKALDGFFCRLEGRKAHSRPKKVNTEAQPENGLGSIDKSSIKIKTNATYFDLLASTLKNNKIPYKFTGSEGNDVWFDVFASRGKVAPILKRVDELKFFTINDELFEKFDLQTTCENFNKKLIEFKRDGNKLQSRKDYFSCGMPSEKLQKCGLKDEIILTQSVLLKSIGLKQGKQDDAHSLTIEDFENYPKLINEPILVIEGLTSKSRLIFSGVTNKKGNQTFAVIYIDYFDGLSIISNISSIYAKPDSALFMLLNEANAKNAVCFVDEKRIKGWLALIGFQQWKPNIQTNPLDGVKLSQKTNQNKFSQTKVLQRIYRPQDCTDTRDCIINIFDCLESIKLLELGNQRIGNIQRRLAGLVKRYNKLNPTGDWHKELDEYRNSEALNGLDTETLIEVLDIKETNPNNDHQAIPQAQKTTITDKTSRNTTQANKAAKSAKASNHLVDIVSLAVSEIHTDEKRFQNRKNSFSEESKNRIIKAIETGSFDWAKFDPIVIWKDSKDGKYYVLSGHSRRAAFAEVSKTDKKYKNIPCKIFKGTEAAAIDLALNSNTLSTKETDIERAGYYHRKLKEALKLGDKERSAAIKAIAAECYDNEGKNAAFILNLGHLNPDGWLVEQMVNLGANRDNENTNTMRTIANWIGEARRIFTSITDMQETEVAKWLLSDGYGTKKGQFRSKTEFMERLRVAVKKWETAGANANQLLNIAGGVTVSTIESEYNKRLSEAKAEFDKAEKEHREAHDKYLLAVFDGKINQTRFDELMKPSIAYVRKCKEAYDRVKGQSGAMREAEKAQLALFGVENQGKSKRRKAATMRPTVAPHCGNGVREPLQKKPMRLPCKKSFDLTKVVPLSLQGFQPLGSIHASKAKTHALPGEIGKFLGRYERQCYSIVLRGDKGAGKSRLLFQIMNAFASKGLKIGFLSLEMNLNSSLFAGYRDQYINKKNIGKIQTSETSLTYDELNDICKQFDVIAVDSWTKLKGLYQSDFDRLQKENPQTIILAIFQSTTGNVTRGGNMPEFDASIVIHVHEGGRAECEKNRYSATDLRYNVFEQKIINEQPEVVE